MAVAAGAAGLDAHHAVTDVANSGDMLFGEGGEETGPACAALELGVSAEQRQGAESAAIDAVQLVIQKSAAEGRLGAMAQQHLRLIAGEVGFQAGALNRVRRG